MDDLNRMDFGVFGVLVRKSKKQSLNGFEMKTELRCIMFGGNSDRERTKRMRSVWNILEEAIERKRGP